jgi:hypothetical protein
LFITKGDTTMSVLPNLKHAAFNHETLIIGDGEFSAKEVLDEFNTVTTKEKEPHIKSITLQKILDQIKSAYILTTDEAVMLRLETAIENLEKVIKDSSHNGWEDRA